MVLFIIPPGLTGTAPSRSSNAGRQGVNATSDKEKWIMAGILAFGGAYFFGWDVLYLIGVGAVIYMFSRSGD